MKVHHIGYLVENINMAVKQFLKLGYRIEQDTVTDNLRKIFICFLVNGEVRVELVQPVDNTSVVYKTAKKFNNMPYHICYETTDLEESIHSLQEDGYMIIQKSEAAPAIDNRNVIFMMNMDIGIIELLEEKKEG